ncbi:MAG: hypothetical protein L0I88_05900 [Alkalibacterium sp.]|nr:hypothetical protein [Alkalibacterium sp.]
MEAEKKAITSGRSKASKYEDSFYDTGADETSPSDAKSDYSPDSVNQVYDQGEEFNFPFGRDSVPHSGQWNSIDNYLDTKYMSNFNARRQSNVRQFNTESEILTLEDFVKKME